MYKPYLIPFFSIALLLVSSCAKLPIDAAFAGKEVSAPSDFTTFAVIGDFGQDSPSEAEVARMVKSWNPEFIITTGDNNYPVGSAATIKNNVGKHYCEYIYNPDAPADRICEGRAANEKTNRFFPCPGNHDNYSIPAIGPYLDYFTLPGNERNYDFVWGPIHFFSLNTGMSGKVSEATKEWLKSKLLLSQATYKVVYFHHPPYSPGNHGGSVNMQFPFSEWGVDAVLSGHEHFYARIKENAHNKPVYLIIGNSGNERMYNCNANPLNPAKLTLSMCDNNRFGAIKVTATKTKMVFEYYTTDDTSSPKDVYEIIR